MFSHQVASAFSASLVLISWSLSSSTVSILSCNPVFTSKQILKVRSMCERTCGFHISASGSPHLIEYFPLLKMCLPEDFGTGKGDVSDRVRN